MSFMHVDERGVALRADRLGLFMYDNLGTGRQILKGTTRG